MQQLTKREDQIMQIVWHLKKAFIRDIMEALPEPKPHYNSVATIVKILVKKGFLVSEKLGNMHRYSATINREDYREGYLTDIKKKYFDNSFPKMIAYFAKEEKLSEKEVQEIMDLIQSNKKSNS